MSRLERPPSSRRSLVVVLGVLTLLHVVYRWHLDKLAAEEPKSVASVAPGTAIENTEVLLATASRWEPGPLLQAVDCQLLVAFDPSCPHCYAAAAREAAADSQDRLPTTWLAPLDSLAASRFRGLVGQGSRVGRSDIPWSVLGVRGVPAALLVNGDNKIRKAWAYRGSETREDLLDLCHSD